MKKSTNLKVFKGHNSVGQKRLTRSADLKKTVTSPPKLPVLTKVSIQNVPKGVTITKMKTVVPNSKPVQKPETQPKEITSKSSPDKPSGTQKFAVVKLKTDSKELPPKSPVTKRVEQRVKLTRAEIATMAKEGKIAVKDGHVFVRNAPNVNSN